MANVLTNQSAKMWQLFVTNLAANSGGSGIDVKKYLPTSGLSPANWEVLDTTGIVPGTPGTVIPASLSSWADNMPVWGASYVPGLSLYSQYSAFLYSIKLKGGDPAQQQIATKLGDKVSTAITDKATTQTQMFADWKVFNAAQKDIPVSAQTTYQAWYNSNYANIMSAKTNNVAAATSNYNAALQKVGGPDYQTLANAIGKVQLSKAAGNAIEDEAGVLWPKYTVDASLNTWFLSALGSSGGPMLDMTIDLSQSKTIDNSSSSYFNSSVKGGYSAFFWGGSASSSYQQSKSATDYSNLIQDMKMTYKAQSLQMFTFNPGNWYDSAIVSAFYDQIDPASALANKALFGEKGILNLETRQILVAFKPEVTLTGENSAISKVTDTFHQASQSSFSVGGWFWGGSASVNQGQDDSNATIETSNNGNSVTMKYNTNTPKVIGVMPFNLNPNS